MSVFDNKVVLVTGASSGLGKATALAFAREGANVVASDMQPGTIADELERSGARAIFVRCDVSLESEIESMIAKTVAKFGRLDFALNNAGIEGAQAQTHECSNDSWSKVIATNLTGVWQCMKYEIAHMLKSGGGAIVNCSSIAGLGGFPNIPAYVASKHGVIGLTRRAALEYAKSNIRVNAVCPGVIQTPMIDRFASTDKDRRALIEQEPVGRMGTPDEIASAVLWLCNPGAAFTTGHALAVDGGWTAR